MSDLISRALLCGLGLASLTKDAIRKTAENLVNRSKLSEQEGRRLVKDLQRRSTQAQKALEKRVKTAVDRALKGLNLQKVNDQLKSAKSTTKPAGKRRQRGAANKAGGR